MKERIKKWLDIDNTEYKERRMQRLESEVKDLQAELGRTQKFIGAIFDYLGVRPQRTFVQDFSRLPEDAIPSMEVIKVNKVKRPHNKKREE